MAEDKPNVVILQDDNGVKPVRRYTWRRYGKGIAFGKWWILGATLVGALAGYLGTRFLLNPMRQTASARFSYENTAINLDDKGGGTYVDGTTFRYASLISESNLKAVKEADKRFSGLDLDKVSNSLKITIATYTDATTGAKIFETPNRFTISAARNDFPSSEVARAFLAAVIETANTKALAAVDKHIVTDVIPNSFGELSFSSQLSLLTSQKNKILDELNGLSSKFTANAIIDETGSPLSSFISDFQYSFLPQGVDVFVSLNNSLKANNWFNFSEEGLKSSISYLEDTAKGYIEKMRTDLIDEKAKQQFVDSLKSSSGFIVTDSEYAALIAQNEMQIQEIIERRNTYLTNLEYYGYFIDKFKNEPTEENIGTIVLTGTEGTLVRLKAIDAGTADEATKTWAKGCQAFAGEINKLKESLVGEDGYAKKTGDAYHYLYHALRSDVTYYDAGHVTLSAGISPWLTAIVGAVLFFVASSLICWTVYVNKIDPVIDEKEPKKESK